MHTTHSDGVTRAIEAPLVQVRLLVEAPARRVVVREAGCVRQDVEGAVQEPVHSVRIAQLTRDVEGRAAILVGDVHVSGGHEEGGYLERVHGTLSRNDTVPQAGHTTNRAASGEQDYTPIRKMTFPALTVSSSLAAVAASSAGLLVFLPIVTFATSGEAIERMYVFRQEFAQK